MMQQMFFFVDICSRIGLYRIEQDENHASKIQCRCPLQSLESGGVQKILRILRQFGQNQIAPGCKTNRQRFHGQ